MLPKLTPKCIFLLVTILSATSECLAADAAIHTAHRVSIPPGSVRIELADGRFHTGEPVSFRDEILILRSSIDSGEVARGFPQDEITRIHFPEDGIVAEAKQFLELADYAQALPHLETIWLQRAPFLGLLESDTLALLAVLPAAHLAAGDPYRAIGLARNLLPHTTAPATINQLHESILIGHHRLEFFQEAEELARDWIQQQPDFPTSALGWKVLADLALRQEDFDQVIWLALQPITLAGPQPMPHLDGCYALAIHAFHKQENTARAAQLFREMTDRGLAWPTDELLATADFYHSKLNEETQADPEAPGPDLDLRPPEEDLNLPIQKVRKLLRTDQP